MYAALRYCYWCKRLVYVLLVERELSDVYEAVRHTPVSYRCMRLVYELPVYATSVELPVYATSV